MSRAFDRFKASAFLVVFAGYLLFNYPFMQLRIPPTGFGIPLGELVLIVVLLSTDLPRVLMRMNATVFLFPFLVWWSWGLGRFVFDTVEQGFWALRDSTQLIESLFLVAGFALAGQPGMMARLVRWLRPIMVISCLYGLLFVIEDDIKAISPTLPGASDQARPIFEVFATTGTILLWGASVCVIQTPQSQAGRIGYALAAGFLVAYALLALQARTTYTQLLAVAGLVLVCNPRALRPLAFAIPLLFVLLIVISATGLQISGRLTTEISPSFFLDHFLSGFGISNGEAGVTSAASGVDLRLGWWTRLYDQLTADEVTLLTGLGYGIPLTDFRDPLGTVVREPHNSIISVTARLGLIGIFAWTWMQVELFRAGFHAYRACLRTGRREAANLIFIILAFAVLTLASCLGEDTMEKPYNAIPYYALWGFLLRIAYQLRTEASPDHSAYSAPEMIGVSRPSTS
jgi:O-Antigen ligase